MARHSKNNCSSSFFTYHEKQMAGYGTTKIRLGKDSMRQFDDCCLCLQFASDPVVCPGGDLFCRECIYSNLLTQRERLDEQKKLYELQEKEKEEGEKERAARSVVEGLEAFKATEGAVAAPSGVGGAIFQMTKDLSSLPAEAGTASARVVEAAKEAKAKEEAVTELSRTAVLGIREMRREHLQRTSFWIPEVTPSADPTAIAKPDPAPKCPECADFLRLKQLVSVKFTRLPAEETDETTRHTSLAGTTAAVHETPYFCGSCTKTLQFQKAAVLKRCGHVFCKKCVTSFVVPTERCLTCETKCRVDKDVIDLKQGGSSFSAHNDVTTSKYRPSLVI